jgi:type II secretory pathway pseudopilin PulG
MRAVGRSRGGFSLLELVVIIIVIGLLMRTALPKLRTAAAVYDLDRAARQFFADLQVAQSDAARRGRTVSVTQVSNSAYKLSVMNGTTEQLLQQRIMAGGSTFVGSWGPVGFRAFGPPTLPAGAPLDIAVSNAGRTRTIRIAAGGAVVIR